MEDKVYIHVFNEMLDKILQLSDNPSQFADYLSRQIREIIGARTIVIAVKKETGQTEIFSVFPTRKKDWANLPEALQLASLSFNYDSIQFLDEKSPNNTITSLLDSLKIEKVIIVPLIAANRKVGSILLVDIMDLFGIDAVIELLTRLSGVFALIIRNSVLYHNLEETVTLRTGELQNRNSELIEREKELKFANEELSINLTKIQDFNVQLEEAKEKAQESDRLKTVFLQNMSHEIRTPMNAIMGFSELLTKSFDDKDKLQKFTTIIQQRSADLLELINEILDLSKIETGQLPVHNEECNLAELFNELHQFFLIHRQKIGKEHIHLDFKMQCEPQQILIHSDKGKLKQIFINLIYNALKFTEKGEILFGCTLDENNKLLYYVSDTGIGIPGDKQSVIFDRFTQLDIENRSALGGTGLGLSIVKGMIDLLGGEITLKSTVGEGSTFYFSLPYRNVKPNETNEKQTQNELRFNWSAFTILIVEDDLYNTEYLKEILFETNISILIANRADKSFEIIESTPKINVILMDVRMPGIDGFEATSIIKSKNPRIKIITQTAFATDTDRRKAIESGCDDYISKPINKRLLLTKISELLV